MLTQVRNRPASPSKVPASVQAEQIRVITVDDSALIRLSLNRHLNSLEDIEVVGQGQNGSELVPLVQSLKPDVVVLDVEMPKMNGLEALQQLMETHPTPVVMLSSLTSDGAAVTLQALEIGAFDFVVKPQPGTTMAETVEILAEKIRWAAHHKHRRLAPRPKPSPIQPSKPLLQPSAPQISAPGTQAITAPLGRHDTLVMVASSTGGPSALTDFLSAIPPGLPIGGVIVQHMPPGFTTILSERLDKTCHYHIVEAKAGHTLQRGQFLVAPGGQHLVFDAQGVAMLSNAPTVNGVRPAADVTMKSLAKSYGQQILAVVLTGMGKDGYVGVKDIVDHGGRVLAQDAESCVVYGMPRHIIEAGLPIGVGSPQRLGHLIQESLASD
jgi:two-component system chemotaxis response regulator CheB